MTVDASLVGQEVIGAELVAGKELIEAVGSFWDTLEKSGAIYQQQWQWCFQDWTSFWTAPMQNRETTLPGALKQLIEQRTSHIAEGFNESGELLRREFTPLAKIWSDYLGVVKRDWNE